MSNQKKKATGLQIHQMLLYNDSTKLGNSTCAVGWMKRNAFRNPLAVEGEPCSFRYIICPKIKCSLALNATLAKTLEGARALHQR